ncbi:MAG: hypothetical protein V1724_09855 [Chloroflexota bacterium]
MPRRRTRNITGIRGTGAVNASTVWRVFQCGKPGCDQLLQASEDDMAAQGSGFVVACPKCGFQNPASLINLAPRWKYCRVCERLQPLENFHRHAPNSSSFRSGRQLECARCKNVLINPRLNPLRTPDQHREASERRRLYGFLSGEDKIDEKEIYGRFGYKCFNCGLATKVGEGRLDHTLPARFFWPLQRGPTLLCPDCNGNKAESWPSHFYKRDTINIDVEKLRKLTILTGIPYELLAGPPQLNPAAVEWLKAHVDEFMERWIRYPEEIKRVRRIVKDMAGQDIFSFASIVPPFLKEPDEQ